MIGFIIMQIGDDELDRVCEQAIVPAIEANDLEARRVDKHNEGGLLKSEIIRFINEAEIIVADLTNERPNVYLEVGYAMGVDKFRNLVLTVRHDHFLDHSGRKPGDPRIHFDLGGYDILPWDPADLDQFRDNLTKRIARRRTIAAPGAAAPASVWDQEWIEEQREAAQPGFDELGLVARMEIRAALEPPKPTQSLRELRDAARAAPIRTFGWPIGVFTENVEEHRPKPRTDGIAASVSAGLTGPSYDYWALRRNGDFYLAKSLFEDKRRKGVIFFNTRIVRVTESILYCIRLYSNLGVDRTATLSIAIRHSGLDERALDSSSFDRDLSFVRRAASDMIETEVTATLDDFEANLVEHVKSFLAPLFELFEFFALNDRVYESIVNEFVAGRVT